MFEAFTTFFYSYFVPIIYGILGAFATFAGTILFGHTRSRGPLLMIIGGVLIVLSCCFFQVLNFFEGRSALRFALSEQLWLCATLIDFVGFVLFVVGVISIAFDFRSFLRTASLEQSVKNNPH